MHIDMFQDVLLHSLKAKRFCFLFHQHSDQPSDTELTHTLRLCFVGLISTIKLVIVRLGNNLVHRVTTQSYMKLFSALICIHVDSVQTELIHVFLVSSSWSLQWSGGNTLQRECPHAHFCQVSVHLPATSRC